MVIWNDGYAFDIDYVKEVTVVNCEDIDGTTHIVLRFIDGSKRELQTKEKDITVKEFFDWCVDNAYFYGE